MEKYNLERFISAQEYSYDTALDEIKAGRKRSHWIWYIFPQLSGLAHSSKAEYYGIKDIGEAKSYLSHPVLGARLIEITEALMKLEENNPSRVMGGSLDGLKLKSCMTLFAYISEDNSIFHKALEKFFGGEKDVKTLFILEKHYTFSSFNNGTCKMLICSDFTEEKLIIPEVSPDGEKVVSLASDSSNLFETKIKNLFLSSGFKDSSALWELQELEEIHVSTENPFFSDVDGVLFDKQVSTLILCPAGKTGKFIVPSTVREIKDGAFAYYNCHLQEAIFQEGLEEVKEQCSLYGPKIVTLPASVKFIHKEALNIEYGISPQIRAPQNSFAHKFAVENEYKYLPSNCNTIWNAENWLERFNSENANCRELRQEVWENTKAIVEANGYNLSDEKSVMLLPYSASRDEACNYRRSFIASFESLTVPTEITVVPDNILDVANEWVNNELEVCILDIANKRNPGDYEVFADTAAQGENLFRCSDYYKFLRPYTSNIEQYDPELFYYQYPNTPNFGGIYSSNVTIFRENEKSGYKLLDKIWKANVISVEELPSQESELLANRIRTIFRIACDNGQRNLVLGGFENFPKNTAGLFRDILCEQEFEGAFAKVCFAFTIASNSENYSAFKKILHGFMPSVKENIIFESTKSISIQTWLLGVKKITIARNMYAILKERDCRKYVFITDIHTGKTHKSSKFKGEDCIDIAGGFDHLIGLGKTGKIILEYAESHTSNFQGIERAGTGRGISVDACEGHSAVLQDNGTVSCYDDHDFGELGVPQYAGQVEKLRNVKQIALTYDRFYYLTQDGKVNVGFEDSDSNYDYINVNRNAHKEYVDSFNNGKEIVQIAAFGAYYSGITLAVLYSDGTVRAFFDKNIIKEVERWRNVKKICCADHGFIFGLTSKWKVLLPQVQPYEDRENNPVTEINDIVLDIAANFDHFVALTIHGKIIYLHEAVN